MPRTGRYLLVLEPRDGFAGEVRVKVKVKSARGGRDDVEVDGAAGALRWSVRRKCPKGDPFAMEDE